MLVLGLTSLNTGVSRQVRKRSLPGKAHRFRGCLMGIMVSEVYEALIEAGASEAKAKAAAEAIPVIEQVATKQDIANLKAEVFNALWIQGAGIVGLVVGLTKLL